MATNYWVHFSKPEMLKGQECTYCGAPLEKGYWSDLAWRSFFRGLCDDCVGRVWEAVEVFMGRDPNSTISPVEHFRMELSVKYFKQRQELKDEGKE